MPRPDDQFTAQQDAALLFNAQQAKGTRKIMVGNQWIDATPYIGMRYPGLDVTTMLGDPTKILKEPKIGARYVWRKPDDRMTRSGVRRQWLRPVMLDEIDFTSAWANVDSRRVATANGPRELVEAIGFGLFEMASAQAEREFEAWERWYISGLAELSETFEKDVDTISSAAMTGSVQGRLVEADTKRESI